MTAIADNLIRNDIGQATRFLQRATFGARPGDVARLQSIGLEAWFDEQVSMDFGLGYFDTLLDSEQRLPYTVWDNMMANPAQLRQRMAFAFSQIMVVSAKDVSPPTVAGYADTLNEHALGDFRALLEAVTLTPAMGDYLSYILNSREDENTGAVPDENFAREAMQLFTIGLWELKQNGERRVDSGGNFIETYDQDDVGGLARVFTGWKQPSADYPERYRLPLVPWEPTERYHEHGEKRFLGTVIPPGTGVRQSLAIALDALSAHDNVAPFISKQLIQRLVTSNPSPDYVLRVAKVFEDDIGDGSGTGKRGNLEAVARAILLDVEALRADPPETFGKLREPVLRWTVAGRAIGASSSNHRWPFGSLADAARALGQQPFESPSVFNFYRPGYTPPGTELADRNMVSPELQLTDASSAVGWINWMSRIFSQPPAGLEFDTAALLPLVDDPDDHDALVDEVERRLCPGRLSAHTRAAILRAVPSIVKSDKAVERHRKVMAAVTLVVASNDFLYER